MAQRTFTKTFYDVEHGGDIDEIISVITKAGGKVEHRNFNYDAEQLELTITVNDSTFFAEVKDSYWFS